MDDLNDILTPVAKKVPIFKKKKILAKDKRAKKDDDAALGDDDAASSSVTDQSNPAKTPLLKGTLAGFRSLKRSRQALGHAEVNTSPPITPRASLLIDSPLNDPPPSLSAVVDSTLVPLAQNMTDLHIGDHAATVDMDIDVQMNPLFSNIGPSNEVYDLDIALSEAEEENKDGPQNKTCNQPLIVKSLADHIEYLQDHIFVLKDLRQELRVKKETLQNRMEVVKIRRQEIMKELS